MFAPQLPEKIDHSTSLCLVLKTLKNFASQPVGILALIPLLKIWRKELKLSENIRVLSWRKTHIISPKRMPIYRLTTKLKIRDSKTETKSN